MPHLPHLPHLETTDSIVEVLWDVALAVFAIRLALLYAGLTCLSAFSLLFLLTRLAPSFSDDAASTCTHLAPLLVLASSAVSARLVIKRCDIPRVLVFRLAVGVVAAVVAGLVGGVVGGVVYEGFGGGRGVMGGLMMMMGGWKTGVAVLGGFAMMPVAMMGWERWVEKGAAVVGRERKGEMQDVGTEKREAGGCE